MEIAGLPLHPLVVHAAVVLIPLSALLAIGLAVLPRSRWLLRWPTAVASVLAIALGFLATTSGEVARRVVYADKVLPVLLVVAALVVLVQVVLTGDSGARAVWG
jgi:hypothetical protein